MPINTSSQTRIEELIVRRDESLPASQQSVVDNRPGSRQRTWVKGTVCRKVDENLTPATAGETLPAKLVGGRGMPIGMLKSVSSLLICGCLTGCSSIVKPHQQRIDRIFSAHEEMIDISKRLDSIERVMIFAGRANDAPLADEALDVAIAIHGQPDDTEKIFAKNITSHQIEKEKERAFGLIAKRRNLKTTIDKEKSKLIDDISALSNLEGKYNFASNLISKCLIGLGSLIAIFLVLKFFL